MSPRPLLIFLPLALLVGASEVTRVWWYSEAEATPGTTVVWIPPAHAIDQNLAETRGGEALAYDAGVQVSLQDPESSAFTELIYLKYEKGNRRTLLDLFLHSPELCLPASGAQLIREFPAHPVRIADRQFQARHWLFTDPITGKPLHAFKLIWSGDVKFVGENLYRDMQGVRLSAALGRREFSAASMILALVSGVQDEDEDEAWRTFQEEVLTHLSPAD